MVKVGKAATALADPRGRKQRIESPRGGGGGDNTPRTTAQGSQLAKLVSPPTLSASVEEMKREGGTYGSGRFPVSVP